MRPGKREVLEEKVRFQLRPTRMPHEEAWARNRASKVTGQRKTDCAMTRSEFFNLHGAQWFYCMFNSEGRRVRNEARMGKKRNSHVFVVEKPERITCKV